LHYLQNPFELALRMAIYQSAYGDAIPESRVFTPIGEKLEPKNSKVSWASLPRDEFAKRV
jgi:hypothetical protein